MKAIFIPCALIVALSGCAEESRGRPLTAAECRELADLEMEQNIKAGNMRGVIPEGRKAIAARSAQLCVETGNFTTTYMTCIRRSRSPDDWKYCKF